VLPSSFCALTLFFWVTTRTCDVLKPMPLFPKGSLLKQTEEKNGAENCLTQIDLKNVHYDTGGTRLLVCSVDVSELWMVCWMTDCGLELLSTPFRCCQMQNFIEDERFLDGLRNELSDLICYEKNNDLYKFHQVNCYWLRYLLLGILCRCTSCMTWNIILWHYTADNCQ